MHRDASYGKKSPFLSAPWQASRHILPSLFLFSLAILNLKFISFLTFQRVTFDFRFRLPWHPLAVLPKRLITVLSIERSIQRLFSKFILKEKQCSRCSSRCSSRMPRAISLDRESKSRPAVGIILRDRVGQRIHLEVIKLVACNESSCQ